MDVNEICYDNNTRSLKLERKRFETEIRKSNSKHAYISYINYEIMLWKTIKSTSTTKFPLEEITEKVYKLYNVALSYFKEDLNLWLSFIKFCMEADFHDKISDIFSRLVLYHKDKSLWLLIAKWEIDEHGNVEKALDFLRSGLKHHPKESSIYSEIYRLELEFYKYSSSSSNIEELKKAGVVKAFDILHTVQNTIPNDPDLYINLLKITNSYSCTTKLQSEIMPYMIKHFSKDENVWCCLSKQELEGHHLTSDNKYEYNPYSSTETRLENFLGMFKKGVNLIKTESMWSKFINTLLDLRESQNYNTTVLKNSFLEACEEAHNKKLLSEEHYLKWMKYLDDNSKLNILSKATKYKPKCLELWTTLVRCCIVKGEKEKIENFFHDAVNILEDESFQIWIIKIQYYQLNLLKDNTAVENTFREGIKYSPKVAEQLKPHFLHWIMLHKPGIARDEYKNLASEAPFSLEVHKKMLELECMNPNPDEEFIQYISKLATEQFGKEIWMEYVQDEIDFGPRWKKNIFKKYLSKKSTDIRLNFSQQ